MNIWVCDCCGKQIDRFVKSTKYDIRKSCRDRTDRAFYLRSLSFCDRCYMDIETMLDKKLGKLPERVDVELFGGE